MSTGKPQITADQQRIVNGEMFTALDAGDFAERIDLCLRKGADINARNDHNRTLLMCAVWKESAMRVRYILGKNPDLFLKDGGGKTAFDLNKDTRDPSARNTITQLLMQAMPDGAPKPGQTAAPESAATPRETGDDILLAPSVNVKSRKKGGGGPTGGFRL
ncbi:MAG: ankyrin repeat domain-containing protein [Alphaproteobacteria bacterium]|nr:ankyrin repeat domain-containing protein [Alphaproteobacteria bacterium]